MQSVNLTQNQLIATLTALELFLEDCERDAGLSGLDIDPKFKKGIQQTINKLEKVLKNET